MLSKTLTLGVALVLAASATGWAQEKAAPENTLVPVKLQLVLSRYQGEKKIASMPYTLWVTAAAAGVSPADRPRPEQLRMGVNLPVRSTRVEEGKPPVTTWDYRNFGTQIDVSARALEGGRFRVELSVSLNALYPDQEPNAQQKLAAAVRIADQPLIVTFASTFIILLRDGETGQYISATDPVSGEVLKVDATLTVLK